MGGDPVRVGFDAGEEVLRVGVIGSVLGGFGSDPVEDGGLAGGSDFVIGVPAGDRRSR